MLARTPLRDQAIAWLEQQGPDQRYEWNDSRFCACAQFARAIGRYDEWEGVIREHRLHENGNPWGELNRCAGAGGVQGLDDRKVS